jgi:regulator of sigma E protease
LPADSLGIKAGDTILAVGGTEIDSWEQMTELIHDHPHDSILVRWQSAGTVLEKKLLPVANKVLKGSKFVEVGLIGISPTMIHRPARFFEAISSGAENTWYWLKITVISLKMLATGEESLKNIGGPDLHRQISRRIGQIRTQLYTGLDGNNQRQPGAYQYSAGAGVRWRSLVGNYY